MNSVFDALAHPTRRRILELLKGGAMTAGALAEAFAVSKPTMSNHFAKLKAAGLIQAENRGTSIVYTLDLSVMEEVVMGFMGRLRVGAPNEKGGRDMRYRNLIIASIVTTAALAVVAAVALGRLPAGTQLPTHWGPDGLADRFADAGTALFMPVALTIVVSLLMAALPSLEPLQDKLEQSAPLYRTAWAGLLGIMALTEAMIAAPAFGTTLPATTMLVGIGALFAALGNVLPKSRPGFFVGIRTPWAIIDPDNWIATHRYGGRIMMASGLALILLALLPMRSEARGSFVVAILLVMIATPILYSFLYWRRTRSAG